MKWNIWDSLKTLCPVRIRPIRDWNFYILNDYSSLNAVRIRPIRDWNSMIKIRAEKSGSVRIRPIRDWNQREDKSQASGNTLE